MEPVFGDYHFLVKSYTFAYIAHKGQVRKFTGEPYFTHCKAVADYVYRFGGTQYQEAAAFLHDTIEDCGVTKDEIAEKIDPTVAEIVWNCTDTPGLKGVARRTAKLRFMNSLPADDPALLVMMCDTLHNLESCRDILKTGDPDAFSSFSASVGLINYYDEKFTIIDRKLRHDEAYARYGEIRIAIGDLLTNDHVDVMLGTTLWEPYDETIPVQVER